jgi:hypothetical protein
MGYGPFHLLADTKVRALGVGLHADGGGLYLQVTNARVAPKKRLKTPPSKKQELVRSWIFRFWDGRRYRKMGLARSRPSPWRKRETEPQRRASYGKKAETPSKPSASSGPPWRSLGPRP